MTSGVNPGASVASAVRKAKRAAAVSDVENNPTPSRFENLLADPPNRRYRRIGKQAKIVCQDISAPKASKYLKPARRRVVQDAP
jgi:hypothetical protein